jgi:anti-anti-sigma regulatory factor
MNLSQLDRATSTVIARLLGLKKRVEGSQGKLVLCCLNQVFREVFASTRLDTFFDILDSERDALTRFSSRHV